MRLACVFCITLAFVSSFKVSAGEICKTETDYLRYCEKSFFTLLVNPDASNGSRVLTTGYLVKEDGEGYVLYFDRERAKFSIRSESLALNIIDQTPADIAYFENNYVRVKGIFRNVSGKDRMRVGTIDVTLDIFFAPFTAED